MKVNSQKRIENIITTTIKLMNKHDATNISMYDIAKECGMATSTVYHYYPNITELYKTLLNRIFKDFEFILEHCIDDNKVNCWQDINRMIEVAYIEYYNKNPVAQKLLLSQHGFFELREADIENDLKLGHKVEMIYRKHFNIPKDLPLSINIFSISLQVADKLYSLSYRKHGKITNEFANEAINLTESYLKLYIPTMCQRT